jgi:integrase
MGRRCNHLELSTTRHEAIESAIALMPTADTHLGFPGSSLKQSIGSFYRIMQRFGITKDQLGVTAHGLRHQYANDRYEACTGVTAPLRGGPAIDAETDTQARSQISEELGHSTTQVVSAYVGRALGPKSET